MIRSVLQVLQILAAILSTKMSGSLNQHVSWTLLCFVVATVLSYLLLPAVSR